MQRTWLQQYPAGVPADIDPSEYASLRDLFDEAVATHGNKPAYVNMGATLTFAQLGELARAFACWLQKKSGLVPGDRVALMMPNILQYPVALFGVLRSGMVVVNTNPLYTARELEHQLVDSGAKCIVIVENFAHVLQQVLPRTGLKQVLVTGIGAAQTPPSAPATGVTVFPTIFLARGSYGQVILQNPEFQYLRDADKSDPLNQTRVVAWKVFYGSILLNQAFLARTESGSAFAPGYTAGTVS